MSFHVRNGPLVQRTIFDDEIDTLPVASMPPQHLLPAMLRQNSLMADRLMPPEPPKIPAEPPKLERQNGFMESQVPDDGMTPGERLRAKQAKMN